MKTKPFPLVVSRMAIKSFLLTMALVMFFCNLGFAEQSQVQVSLSAAPEAQATPGSVVVFTASAQGESGVFEYQFWHKGPSTSGSWQMG